jgi:hypothetical protein
MGKNTKGKKFSAMLAAVKVLADKIGEDYYSVEVKALQSGVGLEHKFVLYINSLSHSSFPTFEEALADLTKQTEKYVTKLQEVTV